ncbi:MAG: hypothetical protein ABMA64_01520 [Myxococcota bacterium]
MRLAPLAVALAACTPIENELRYTSTLQAETSGVALSDDGLDGHAAMSGTTCTIDVNWGCPVADMDLPTPHEFVVDHHGGDTLGASDEGAHTIGADGSYEPSLDIPAQGIHTGRIWAGGTVLLGGGADSCWIQYGTDAPIEVPSEACADDADFAVDRADGTMFVAGGGAVVAAGVDGVRELATGADRVAWDAAGRQLLVATAGDRSLSALDRDGAARWTVEVDGTINQVAARGSRGEIVLWVEREDGFGSIERRDGQGNLLARSEVPGADGELIVSENGVRLALVRDDEVNFFALETDGDEPVRDTTPPVCIDPEIRVTRD